MRRCVPAQTAPFSQLIDEVGNAGAISHATKSSHPLTHTPAERLWFHDKRRLLNVVSSVITTVMCAIACTLGARAADRPNIVLIFADDLGYGDLGCFGHPTIQTPNLDALAARGVRLTSFYSAPSCVPARTQLMLGKYSGRMNLGGVGPGGTGGIPDEEKHAPRSAEGRRL